MSTASRKRLLQALAPAALLIGVTHHAGAVELPLSRVVLSSSGLAQFTHSGPIDGGTTVDLAVRLDQVDDILQSLTVFDRQGAIGTVSLPGKTPLAELFRDLPFGPDALNSPAALLNALVGSEVEISGQVNAKGRVLRVEDVETRLPNAGGTTTRHRLTLLTYRGLVQAILEEVTTLSFTDPQVKAQIERALGGLTENRAKDRRRLAIEFLGQGNRNVAISYVVAAPIWKTAYRLVLPSSGGDARLQGWAVVENLTGGDWNDVDLVLVSGNPVALRQPLYTAVFADRIEVPVTTAVRIMPRTDDADERQNDAQAKSGPPVGVEAGLAARAMSRARVAPLPAPPAAALAPAPSELGAAANAAEAEEASTQLLYRFPAKVSLATGYTMMVPFVDREVAATRVWLYQPDTDARHPLAAVRVRNDGESGLPPGIVTAYDAAADGTTNFVGDARLPVLPKGAFKYVSFALDTKTDIRREDRGVVRTELGKAVRGTLTVSVRSRRTIAYEISAPADEDREIIVEEARTNGWKPAVESQGVEETPTQFRYTVNAPRGQVGKASLVLERADSQTVVLTTLQPADMLARIRGLQNASPALRDTVAKLDIIVSDIARDRSQRAQLDSESKKIAEDQDRIRRNLQSVGQASDLGRRYIGTLKTQEDRLADIDRANARLEADIAAKRLAAEDLARNLEL